VNSDHLEVIAQLPDRIPFSKFSASANDFIVMDNRSGQFTHVAPILAKRLCSHRYSVGADGLILIENSKKASFRVRYFNPDGQQFNTCGNGGRCAVRYAFLSVIAGRKMNLETNVGVIDAEVIGSSVRIRFVSPSRYTLNVPVNVDGQTIKGHFVRLGEPHFLLYVKDIRNHDILPLARKIRYHDRFQPEGTNVHFIEPVDRHYVKIRSYERGVENETLACGSGCISSAIATYATNQTAPPITFEPQSGIPVSVHFPEASNFQELYLEGDARLVYRGELTKEALLGFP
jgi:diaminopimelate epimerase